MYIIGIKFGHKETTASFYSTNAAKRVVEQKRRKWVFLNL